MISEIIAFILFFLLFIIIPSFTFINFFKIKVIDDILIKFGLYTTFGLTSLTILSLTLKLLSLSPNFLWLLPIISFVYLVIKKLFDKLTITLKSLLSVNKSAFIIILISTLAQNLIFIDGGKMIQEGIILPSLHDSMWNLSIVNELSNNYLPQHPGVSGIQLKNFHYFYHLLIATSHQITNIDKIILYYRFWPIVVSLLFGIGLYAVSCLFIQNHYFRALTVFLGYSSGNFAYLLPLFLGAEFNWQANTFFMDQPFDQITNPYTVLGFAVFLFGIYSFSQAIKNSSKLTINWTAVMAIIFGTLYGFKSFGGLLSIMSISAASILLSIYYKKVYFLLILFATSIVFIPIFFLITDITKTSLVFAPGWILTETFIGKDKLNLPNFAAIESYYKAISNVKGLIKIKIIEFAVYTIGNLGMRIVGFIYITYLIFKRNKVLVTFCFISSIVAFSIPLLFNLRNKPFDIIQFSPYALIIWAIFSGASLEFLYKNYIKNRNLIILIVTFFIILTIPVNIKVIINNITAPEDKISFYDLQILRYLRDNSNKDDVILINPKHFAPYNTNSIDPMYISALSERRLYLTSQKFASHTGNNPDERVVKLEKFLTGRLGIDFIIKNKIRYFYVPVEFLDRIRFKEDTNPKLVQRNVKIALYELEN